VTRASFLLISDIPYAVLLATNMAQTDGQTDGQINGSTIGKSVAEGGPHNNELEISTETRRQRS